MSMEDFKRVVDLSHDFCPAENVHRDPWDCARADTWENGSPTSDYTSCWRDGDQACYHTLHCSNNGGPLEKDHIHDHPGEQADSGAEIRIEHRDTSIRTGSVRISSVEAIPSCP